MVFVVFLCEEYLSENWYGMERELVIVIYNLFGGSGMIWIDED